MDRRTLLELEQARATRAWIRDFELREDVTDPDVLMFVGWASVTGVEYPVMGGEWPGWMETVAPGAFKRTLKNRADVAFLVNHEGLTLARTKSGTLQLTEVTEGEPTGLRVEARLDRRMQPVADLLIASRRGDVDEMSFAFRVVRDDWYDDDGQPSNPQAGTRRTIREVNLNKGDVSVVNYGANPATSGAFRALEGLRTGRRPSPAEVAELRRLIDGLDPHGGERVPSEPAAEVVMDVSATAGTRISLAYARILRDRLAVG